MRDNKRLVFVERVPIVFHPTMNQRERRQWQKVNVQSIKAIRGISKKSLEGDCHDR